MPRTWAPKRWWLVFWLYVGIVFAAVPFARDVVLTLGNSNLLGALVTGMYGLAFAVVVYHVFFDLRQADWVAFLVVAALICVIAGLLLGMSIPEERVHFLQYAAMAMLARAAISKGSSEPRVALRSLALAALLTSALGFLEECLQGMLPSREFDWRDVGIDAGAAVVALALDELLHDRIDLRGRAARRTRGAAVK